MRVSEECTVAFLNRLYNLHLLSEYYRADYMVCGFHSRSLECNEVRINQIIIFFSIVFLSSRPTFLVTTGGGQKAMFDIYFNMLTHCFHS
mmetsp:Transcript_953/g.2056  ORF Transcript_953/g.2056 Transcript_953/m.2056 type:complete len:90 (+) Transcript_953:2438-2707(+)